MLGEMIGTEQGKITGIRVLPFDGSNNTPKLEVSFQGSGELVGVKTTNVGTYISVLTAAGVFNGAGQGMITTKNGDIVTWTATGIGKPAGEGLAASWRGIIYYQTSAQQLAGLNKIPVVFEYEVDENGNTTDKLWEWK